MSNSLRKIFHVNAVKIPPSFRVKAPFRRSSHENLLGIKVGIIAPKISIDRRSFLAGIVVSTNALWRTASSVTLNSSAVKLGVASYSLRQFSLEDAIDMIQELGATYVNVKSYHLPYEASPEKLAVGRGQIEKAGLKIVGGGTISLREDDDDHIRSHFEYAKDCGMPLMVIAPTWKTIPKIEKFVKEYDIKVAIHNHGPEDEYFPTPQDALKAVKGRDPRFGLCIDVGHTARTGVDVVESIVEAGPRLLDMHMKDLKSFSEAKSQCVVGEGLMPVEAIFKQLQSINFQGFVNLEYEIFPNDPLPGMKESFMYMREVLSRL